MHNDDRHFFEQDDEGEDIIDESQVQDCEEVLQDEDTELFEDLKQRITRAS